MQLVLSLFPGLDLLGAAFEAEGFTVVRGPDLIWGTDVRSFHVPSGRFDGVIGGPPCQSFSRLRYLNPAAGKHGDLIPEFTRIVAEARPSWFLMENVREAYVPAVEGYAVDAVILNNRWVPADAGGIVGAEQHRIRRFSFGTADGRPLRVELASAEHPLTEMAVTTDNRSTPVRMLKVGQLKTRVLPPPTVLAAHGDIAAYDYGRPPRTVREMLRLQGVPESYLDECPLTEHGKRKLIGNAVPLPMGRAVAKAVKAAIDL